MGKAQSKGKCVFCGREMSKSGMTKHLGTCEERKAKIEKADQGDGRRQKIYHLQVLGEGGDHWLHLEMQGNATLEDLDDYLRDIWLECCGHLSHFSDTGWGGIEFGIHNFAENIFPKHPEMIHLYDYGTTSETKVRVLDVREGGVLSRYPIYLMARNEMPEAKCMECDAPAAWLCIECVYEDDKSGYLCEAHAEEHPHDDYGEPMPLVNSPRTGMCGYDGPAEPPY